MIDLQAFRCSSADFDAIIKRQSIVEKDDVVENKDRKQCEEKPKSESKPQNDIEQIQTDLWENTPTQQQRRDLRGTFHPYETIADYKYDDVNNAQQPSLPKYYRKWVCLILLGVALVSLIVGAASGAIATLLLNQKMGTPQQASIWTSWGICSRSCGIGIRHRSRECPEITDNNRCSVSTEEFDLCMKATCQDGVWTTWSLWSPCDVTCDVGVRIRIRDCQNNSETVLGSSCLGLSSEANVCYLAACRDGGWAPWEEWSACFKTCDGEVQTRDRHCTNPTPSLLGSPCIGSPTESQTCNTTACKAGLWNSWNSWTGCSACGGVNTRNRSCSGNGCNGEYLQVLSCNNYWCHCCK